MLTTERCETCKHSSLMSGYDKRTATTCCLYILDTGEARGCPAGDECDKYEQIETLRMIDPYGNNRPGYRKWKPKKI